MTPSVLFQRGVLASSREWAVTRPPLVVEALLAGKALLVSMSMRPDPALIGSQIWLHGSGKLPAITPLQQNQGAQRLICDLAYRGGAPIPVENWRKALDALQARGAGRVRGSALLAGAFVAGGLVAMSEGRSQVRVFRPDTHAHFYLGDFMAFSGERQVCVGPFDPPVLNELTGKFEGARWVWCFCSPERGDPLRGQVLSGFGGQRERGECGVWDLRAGAALRAAQAREAQTRQGPKTLDKAAEECA